MPTFEIQFGTVFQAIGARRGRGTIVVTDIDAGRTFSTGVLLRDGGREYLDFTGYGTTGPEHIRKVLRVMTLDQVERAAALGAELIGVEQTPRQVDAFKASAQKGSRLVSTEP